jgi:hypothetical protein
MPELYDAIHGRERVRIAESVQGMRELPQARGDSESHGKYILFLPSNLSVLSETFLSVYPTFFFPFYPKVET